MGEIKLYFSDFFNIDTKALEEYGAFNISLKSDLPMFIDPFLLFNSNKAEYKKLHEDIILYLQFLRDKANLNNNKGFIKYYYTFSEVTQNWLGFSAQGNSGSGLGNDFAQNLNQNLHTLFVDFGTENVTKGSHLEKLCLIQKGVGKDNISDFTTNLIKEYLLNYTEKFAQEHVDPSLCKKFKVAKVKFNYNTESWESADFFLPYFKNDYVLLTPKDLLTRDEIWINKQDMIKSFDFVINSSATNEELRAKLNNYLQKALSSDKKSKKKQVEAKVKAYAEFPDLIDFYIRYKEDNSDLATDISRSKVKASEFLYLEQFKELAKLVLCNFPAIHADSYKETQDRIDYMKQVIENNDGYKLLYDKSGNQITTEKDLQILFRFVWFDTSYDVNREPNNGRGPVDYKISAGSRESTLAEFKLASSSKLKQNLKKQLEIYKDANQTEKGFKVIFFFSNEELNRVNRILKELSLDAESNIILIDCRKKESASNVK